MSQVVGSQVPRCHGLCGSQTSNFKRTGDKGSVSFHLDGKLISKAHNVGVPLDVQGKRYPGIYPSMGPGERLAQKIGGLAIGHGLFSLLDAFPFQHPEAPELAVDPRAEPPVRTRRARVLRQLPGRDRPAGRRRRGRRLTAHRIKRVEAEALLRCCGAARDRALHPRPHAAPTGGPPCHRTAAVPVPDRSGRAGGLSPVWPGSPTRAHRAPHPRPSRRPSTCGRRLRPARHRSCR
jgi:hypothetical protein